MNKNFARKSSFLTHVAFIASYGAQFGFFIGFLIESISNVQTLSIILKTSISTSQDNELFIIHHIRNITSYLSLLRDLDILDAQLSIFLVWLMCSVYLFGYLTFMIFVAALCIKGKKVTKWMKQAYTIVNIFHSKVLFSPICYFYFSFILGEKQCAIDKELLFFCESYIMVITIVFITLNFLLAFLKEIYFYQTYKNKNVFSVTSNLHAITQLTHKAILSPVLTLRNQNMLINSILNICFTFIHHEILFKKLPLYNLKCLKGIILQSTVCAITSFTLFWGNFASKTNILELITFIFTPLLVKLMLQRLNYIFEKILYSNSTSYEYLIHLPDLIKCSTSHLQKANYAQNLDLKTFCAHSTLKLIDPYDKTLDDYKQLKIFKLQFILKQLIGFYRRNPKSIGMLLFLVQFYVEKIKNVPEAIIYMQRIENLTLFIPSLNHLNQIRNHLRKSLLKTYSNNNESLELISYFKYRDVSDTLKKNIEQEITKHAELWQKLSKTKIEVHKAIKISQNIEAFASKIDHIWKENETYFQKNFPIPLILYITYLFIIRELPHLAQTLMEKSIEKNKSLVKYLEKWLSKETAFIIVSNQKDQLGKVLDASYSVKTLFNIDKDDLIGKQINILMPNMIRERHDVLIQRYNETPVYDLDRKLQAYCKTSGGLFFLADLKVKVYPYIEKESAMIGIIDKKEEATPMLMIDTDGKIVDGSQELLDVFHLNLAIDKNVKIYEISPHFEKINTAFNHVYLNQSSSIPSLKEAVAPLQNEREDNPRRSNSKTLTQTTQNTRLNSEITPIIQKETSTEMTKNSENIGRRISQEEQIVRKSSKNLVNKDLHQDESKLGQRRSTDKKFSQTFASPKFQDEGQITKKDANEYKKICENLTEGSFILFKSKPFGTKNEGWLRYFVTVDHFVFENQLYKAITMKRINRKNRNFDDTILSRLALKKQSRIETILTDSYELRKRMSQLKKETSLIKSQEKSNPLLLSSTKISKKELTEGNLAENCNIKFFNAREEPLQNQCHDKSKAKEILNEVFTKERKTTLTRVYFGVFYFTVLLVIVIAGINLSITRRSFEQIDFGIKLAYSDSLRLSNLIKLWGGMNVIYYYSKVRESAKAGDRFYSIINQQIEYVKQANRDITTILTKIESEEIINEFYKQDIQLWDNNANEQTESLYFDVFMASNIVIDKMRMIANQSKYMLSADEELNIFVVNNTANGLVLSAEKELQITERIKSSIYSDNLSILKALVIYQILSLITVFLSLLALSAKILKSYKNMFRVISSIPSWQIDLRKRKLILFQEILSTETESMTFIHKLNSFLQENSQNDKKHNLKAIGFKEDKKFDFNKIIIKGVFLLVFALCLFSLIFGLFYFSNKSSLDNFDSLKREDSSLFLTTNLGKITYLLNGNLICWMSFYNQTDIQLRKESLGNQLNENIKIISDLNQELISTFGGQEEQSFDPIVKKLLSGGICDLLRPDLDTFFCEIVTKGDVAGLLGIIKQYALQASSFVEEFENNFALTSDLSVVGNYIFESLPFVASLEISTQYLSAHFLEKLSQIIEDQRSSSTKIFSALCVVCIFVTLFIRFLILEKFAKFDKKRHHILTLIPFNILRENKVIVFYIKREFPKDINELKFTLQI